MDVRWIAKAALVASLIYGSALQAAPPTRPATYNDFVLSAADKSAMRDRSDATCIARALRKPNDVDLQAACNAVTTTRLEARVRQAIARTTPRAMTQKLKDFNTEQTYWVRNHVNQCENKWGEELNMTSNSYRLAVSQCVAEEVYRRALWIEWYR